MPTMEVKNQLLSREAVYRLLSACYYQPCTQWSESDLFGQLSELMEAVSPEALAAAGRMSAAWGASDLEELTVDYARLFVGPMSLQAPPYGSVYLEGEKKVMGASTIDVLKFYRESGLELQDDFSEMPDHIAVELEFLSYLLQRSASSENEADLKSHLDRGRYFTETFLEGWYRQLCAAIRLNTANRFYLALADCTEQLLSQKFPAFHA